MTRKSDPQYSIDYVLKAINAQNDELARCQGVQDLNRIIEALGVRRTFPDDSINVPRDSIERVVHAALDDINRDRPFRETILPKRVRKTLTSRKRDEMYRDRVRALVFLGHLVVRGKQNQAIEDTLTELDISRSTLFRSLARLCQSFEP